MQARRNDLKGIVRQPTTHAGLWLDKFLPEQNEKGAEGDAGVGAKAEHIAALAGHPVPPGYREAFSRWRAALEREGVHLAEAEAEGRVVLGLGAKGVLEAGLTLDHTWGTPVLSASALKGLAAAAARRLVEGEDWQRKRANDTVGPSYARLFGTTEHAGSVRFLDAWWVCEGSDRLPIDLDVMTVHHPTYYQQGTAPPADTDSPNPVAFATTRGRFLVAVEATGEPEERAAWVDAAFELLALGLRELGIGAKTNAGYGRMRLDWRSAAEAERERMSPVERADREYAGLLGAGVEAQVAWLLGAQGDPKQPPSSLSDPVGWRAWVAERLAGAITVIRRQLDEASPELAAARAALAEQDARKPGKKDKDAKKLLKGWQKQRDKLAKTVDNLERGAANLNERRRSLLGWFEG